jgi:DNA-binding CsgD family transcriptional regulator
MSADLRELEARLRHYERAFARITRELAELGVALNMEHEDDVRADADLSRLSPREAQVLRSLLEGRSLPAIGEELRIALPTVRNHLKSIFRKLGVRSQAELLQMFVRPPGFLRD